MYVMCCPCCAAGDIARAAGRDYCMSCFVIPFCLGFIQPCWWSYDRQALAARLGIEDPFSGSGEFSCVLFTKARWFRASLCLRVTLFPCIFAFPHSPAAACLLFCCGCGTCLLCQELNTVKAATASGLLTPGGAAVATTTTTVVIASQQAQPQQQTMAAAPVGAAPAY